MPIRGLTTEQDESLAFVRYGKIRKGAPKGANMPGRDLDHFRVTFEKGYAGIKPAFDAKFGAEPKSLPVTLVGRTPGECFPTWLEAWNATSLIHRCDGERQEYGLADNGRYYRHLACAKGDDAEDGDLSSYACGCTRIGRLTVAIPWMWQEGGADSPGVFILETHSIYDILHLHNRLSTMSRMYGNLLRVPALLERKPREISHAIGGGKRKKRFSHLLDIREDLTRMSGAAFLESPAVPVSLPDAPAAQDVALPAPVEVPADVIAPDAAPPDAAPPARTVPAPPQEGAFQFEVVRLVKNDKPTSDRAPKWWAYGAKPADGYAARVGLWDIGFIADMLGMYTDEELESAVSAGGLDFGKRYPLLLAVERKGQYINIQREGHIDTLANPAIGRIAGLELLQANAAIGAPSETIVQDALGVERITDSPLTLAGARQAIAEWAGGQGAPESPIPEGDIPF